MLCVPVTDNLYQVGPDFAQVNFNLQRDGQSTIALIPQYALFATNADCYDCAPMLILPANSTLLGQCSWMWTPFTWTFMVRNTVTGENYPALALTDVQLGEHGMYNINAVFSADAGAQFIGLNLVTATEPGNPMTALWVWLFAILLPIVLLNFTGARLAIWIRQTLAWGFYRAARACLPGSQTAGSAAAGYDSAADDADSQYHLLAESGAPASTPRVKFDKGVSTPGATPTCAAALCPVSRCTSCTSCLSHISCMLTPVSLSSSATHARHPAGSFWEAFLSPTAGDTWQDKPSFSGGSTLKVPLVSPAADSPMVGASSGSAVYRGQKGNSDTKESAAPADSSTAAATVKPAAAASAAARLDCLDTFRGMCLTFMIFVNYGGGAYWFFDHAAWNGLTFADLLFPWFMWVMGVSMALSMKKLHTDEYRGTDIDPYCKVSGASSNSNIQVTMASTSTPAAAAADKRYVVNTLEHGSAAGWSQIESEPSSPLRTAENSGGSSPMPVASSTAKGPREVALAEAAGLDVTPPQTPLPRRTDPQGAAGGSASSKSKRNGPEDGWVLWQRVLRRVVILFCIGLFLNNGYKVSTTGHWRLLGVLQYFSVSTLLVAGTVLTFRKKTAALLAAFEAEQLKIIGSKDKDGKVPTFVLAGPEFLSTFGPAATPAGPAFDWADYKHWLRLLDLRTSIMWCYRYEYAVMATIFTLFLIVCLGVAAPGCEAGYNGPGGRASEYADEFCTGGIHRYIDMQLVGYQHMYHSPTCIPLYGCQPYDPEGVLGMLTAATLTYLGLITGRILMHYPSHSARLWRWGVLGSILCFIAACLCGFSQNDGLIPVSKNLWSASFGLLLAGGGMLGLSVTYVFVDYLGWWTGAPFRYYGLNSILLFCAHEIFQEYFPFEWDQTYPTHMSMLTMNIVGVTLWGLFARWCYSIKFCVKV